MHKTLSRKLWGASLIALGLAVSPASVAQEQNYDEQSQYVLLINTQKFDGAREISQSQSAGIARVRRGDESYTRLDYGDGGVVIETPNGLQTGQIFNFSDDEAEFHYDYASQTLNGANATSDFFNQVVRPYLNQGPEVGKSSEWSQRVVASDLMSKLSSSDSVEIEFAREYFDFDGKQWVLVQYEVPAFSYDLNGSVVVHWGRGAALMDASFGQIFWNGVYQRAAMSAPNGEIRPYRYSRSIYASDETGEPIIDFASIPVAGPLIQKYGDNPGLEAVPFVENRAAIDQAPLEIASRLDVIALGIAENGANKIAETVGEIVGGQRGDQEGSAADALMRDIGIAMNLWKGLEGDNTRALAILDDIDAQANRLIYDNLVESNKARARVEAITSEMSSISKKIDAFLETEDTYQFLGNIDQVEGLKKQYATLQTQLKQASAIYADLNLELAAIEHQAEGLVRLVPAASKISATAAKLRQAIPDWARNAGSGTLETLGYLGSAATVFEAAYNVNSGVNTTSGELRTTGTYASLDPNASTLQNAWIVASNTGLDIGSMFGNLAAGNVPGAATEGIALLTKSTTDIYITGKGVYDIERLNFELYEQNRRMENKRSADFRALKAKEGEEKAEKYILDLLYSAPNPWEDGYLNQSDPRVDPATGLPRPGYWAWLKENSPGTLATYGIDPDAPVGSWPLDENGRSTEPTAEDWEKFNEAMKDATKPDYPTAPPSGGKKPDPNTEDPEIPESSELPDDHPVFEDPAKAAADELREYQERILAERAEEQRRIEEARLKRIRENGLNIDPVTFDFPEWDPPKWDPPKWVPPEFDAPEFSGFDWTNFDDDDWPGSDKSLSFKFATDTSRWDEWIDLIGRRKLERLARDAGFYTLAEALKNWKLLLDNYNDPDWVRWALNPPACSPSLGCGPNFLGRWNEGLARLELGRLISQSRDVFSTAGLSDIAIFGFNLEYMMRDFGLEDGDLVEIVITQFGREVFRSELSLLNAGTDFDVRLFPGVASLTITALNEGAVSPNTAQITIDNVAEGESDQTYSLLEGEQAVLRVETGR